MSLMNRMAAKTFLKTFDKYESQKEMVECALDPIKPTMIKSLSKYKDKLDDTFLELVHDWKNFKRDLNISTEEFNGLDDQGEPNYEHNDA